MIDDVIQHYMEDPDSLVNVTIELNSFCNLKCCHCYVENRGRHMKNHMLPTEDVKRMIQEAYQLNAMTLVFTGGEPMLHPGIWEILEYARNVGFIIFLKTNGTLIDENTVIMIKKFVNSVILSRYGYTKKTYELVTQVDGSYEKYEKSLNLLREHNINYSENGILLKENEEDIDRFIASGLKLEKYISIQKDDEYAAKHRISDKSLKQYYKTRVETLKKIPPELCEQRVCNAGTCSLTINSRGEVNPCTNFYYSLGSIYEKSLEEIWNSEQLRQITERCKFKYFTKCVECKNRKYILSMAPCNNFAETGNMNLVSSEMCRHCRIIEEVLRECSS